MKRQEKVDNYVRTYIEERRKFFRSEEIWKRETLKLFRRIIDENEPYKHKLRSTVWLRIFEIWERESSTWNNSDSQIR